MAVAAFDPSWIGGSSHQKLAIGLSSTNYVFEKATVPQQSFNTIELQSRLESESERMRLGFQAQALYTVGSSVPFNLDVNQAYIGTGSAVTWGKFTVGRKVKQWNELDEAWKMGIWQPRFLWDPFQAGTSGLTGVFFDKQIGDLELTAFGSGLNVPELGYPRAFDNGKVLSPSRWARPVPAELPLMPGLEVPVAYTLSMPDLTKLLLNPSVAVRARYGARRGFWGAAAYAYKPINQLQMAMDGFLDINSSFQVTLRPRIISHHVATLETGFQSEKWNVTLSSLLEVPVKDSTPASWTTQQLAPAIAVGPLVRWSPQGAGRVPRLMMGYLLEAGGDAPDQGPLADPAQSAFDPRYLLQHALLLDGETDLGSVVSAGSRAIVDIYHGSVMLSPQLRLRWRDSVSLAMGADVFATGAKEYATAGFLGQSVQNTRFFGRVSYGF